MCYQKFKASFVSAFWLCDSAAHVLLIPTCDANWLMGFESRLKTGTKISSKQHEPISKWNGVVISTCSDMTVTNLARLWWAQNTVPRMILATSLFNNEMCSRWRNPSKMSCKRKSALKKLWTKQKQYWNEWNKTQKVFCVLQIRNLEIKSGVS